MILKSEHGRKKEAGFTLIELVLIILVVSILAAVVIPKFGEFYGGFRLSGAADKMVNDIRYAQSLAATTRNHHKVTFPNGTSYQVIDISTGNPVKDPLTRGNMIVDLTQTEFSGTVITLPTGLSGDYVEFDGLGIPYDGSGTLSSSKNIVLTAGSESKTITIQLQTGKVSHN